MVIAVLSISVYFIFQSLCFQTEVAYALTRSVGPVDIDTVDRQHVCKWFFDERGRSHVYRCCSGFYYNGSQCIECPEGRYGYGCGGTCKCTQYEQCDSVYGCRCQQYYWGSDCQKPCRQSCLEFEFCDSRTGKCSCPPGKYGRSCQYDCACYNRATCQKDSGQCKCETGWPGDTCTNCNVSKVYPNGKNFCTERCLHCFNGALCDINLPGDCDCTPGWTGNKCDVSIPVTCDSRFNTGICRNHSDCDEPYICNVKKCTCDRCIKGYRGEQCNLPCESGKHGYGCKYSCSQVCGNETCHHVTGNCKTCPIGYHGKHCDVTCPDGYYGYNCQEKCQCGEYMTCNHELGCSHEKDSTTPMSYSASTTQQSEVTTLGQSDTVSASTTQQSEVTTLGQSDTDSASTTQQSEVTIRRQSDTVSALITQQPEVTMRGRPENQDPVTNGPNSTTKQIQDSENRINGDLDDIAEDNLPLIVGVCVFLVVLVIVIVIICIVCCRRKKRTENKRNVHYENVDVAAERTDNLAMFVSTNDYEMADVGTPGTTILTNDRHPTNLQHGDDGSNGDEDNRNRGIPEYAQVDKTRKKQTMAVVRPHYSEVAVNGETSTAESRKAPREAVHYYTLEEVDDKQTNFTGARALSGGPHSEEAVSGSDGGAHREVDCQSQNAPRDDVHYYTLEEVDNKQTNFTGARELSGRPNSEEGVSGSDGGARGGVDCQSQNASREDVHYYTLEEVDDKQANYTGARVLSGGPHSEERGSGSYEGAHEEEDYNVVDRTGKSYKIPLDGNEPVNYERLGMGKEDVPTYEDTDYNKLNFGPKQFESNQESDYSSYQH